MRLCVNNQTAFGGMLQQLVELTSIVLRPEPLDDEIERRCKHAWEEAPCPDCGETAINAGDSSPRLWCSNCRYTFTEIATKSTGYPDTSKPHYQRDQTESGSIASQPP